LEQEKKSYEKPKLTIHGNIEKITAGGGTVMGEPQGDPYKPS
jgi:hypothetical protein